MKKVSAIVVALIFLLCVPVYADEAAAEDIAAETTIEETTIEETTIEEITMEETLESLASSEMPEISGPAGANISGKVTIEEDTEAQSDNGLAEDVATDSSARLATDSNCRVSFPYEIAVPNNAAAKGLDPLYKVESSYADENGVTWYVMAGPKKVKLSEHDCSIQKYWDVDTDSLMRKQIVSMALERLGCPYAFGKSGPLFFDCSGFVQYCLAGVGISVPRSSYAVCSLGSQIDKSELKAGDIVATPGHVGIYIGNGCFIHAQDHSNGVVTDFLDVYNEKSYKKFKNYINVLD